LKTDFHRVLMSATGTSPKIRGALRRGSADVTPSGGVAYTEKAITKLWEEFGFMYLQSMMCAVI
jgi:hypothetical protein